MKIIHSISNFSSSSSTIVTIGTFDGIHVGHQKILKDLIDTAKKEGKKSVLLTFFPHPRMVLQKDKGILLLNTINEKSFLLKKMGLDFLIIHPFSKEFSRLTALDFVRDVQFKRLRTHLALFLIAIPSLWKDAKLIGLGKEHHFDVQYMFLPTTKPVSKWKLLQV